MQQDLVDLSLSNAFSIAKLNFISIKTKANSAKLIDTLTSHRSIMIHLNNGSSQFIVKYIFLLGSEGAQFAPMITASVKAALTFFNIELKLIVKSASDALRCEGAQTVPTISSIGLHGPASKLIVICNWKKISLIF